MRGEDGVAEAGGEAFDLIEDGEGHVFGAGVGDMAIGPAGVFSIGGAGVIEEALLGDEDEGFLGDAVFPGIAFGRGDFGKATPDVDGTGAAAGFGEPGDGLGEGEIEFEDRGAVSVAAEFLLVGGGKTVLGDIGEGGWRGIEEV